MGWGLKVWMDVVGTTLLSPGAPSPLQPFLKIYGKPRSPALIHPGTLNGAPGYQPVAPDPRWLIGLRVRPPAACRMAWKVLPALVCQPYPAHPVPIQPELASFLPCTSRASRSTAKPA